MSAHPTAQHQDMERRPGRWAEGANLSRLSCQALEPLVDDRKSHYCTGINDSGGPDSASQTAPSCQPPSRTSITTIKRQELNMARAATHPGEHLADELQELGMSAAELARQLAVPVSRITQIINGQRAITADTALRLGHWFNTGPEVWLNLQQLYELRRARQAVGTEIDRLPKRTAEVSPPTPEATVQAPQ